MEEKKGIEKKFWELCSNIVEENGLKLYDVDYLPGMGTLRVFICKTDSLLADISDCVKVDRAMTEPIETLDWIPETLTLEVSSPGVYRSLKSLDHYKGALGEFVKTSFRGRLKASERAGLPKALEGQNTVRGELIEVENDGPILKAHEYNIKLLWNDIKKSQVDPDFDSLLENATDSSDLSGGIQ